MKREFFRCLPMKSLRRIFSLGLRFQFRQRRRVGKYDPRTLALCKAIFAWERSLDSLLLLQSFRRDLGLRLSPLARKQLRNREALPPFAGAPSVHGMCVSDGLGSVPVIEIPGARGVVWNGIARRTKDFEEELRTAARRGIAVVGNAPQLAGAGHGAKIDEAGFVVRFNQFATGAPDFGKKTDVLVRSPSFEGGAPLGCRWQVVSGADAVFRVRRDSLFAEWIAPPTVGVALEVWRDLVRELEAPPSAGVLTLAWFHRILDSWKPLCGFGFGFDIGQYHAGSKRFRPGKRHDWEGERRLLSKWKQQGLDLV